MSVFTPARRWQPAFYPFRKEKLSRRLLALTERLVKGPLFGCRMCGNCLLQETAFICSMECPKGIRNGPCGGSTARNCYVDETRKCIWYCIYQRAFKMKREELLLEVMPPLDWDKAGTETWGEVFKQVRKVGFAKFIKSIFSGNKELKKKVWNEVFRPIRQPEWWRGDPEYHPPAYTEPVSGLERRLRAGEFVVTTEIIPPLGCDGEKLRKNIAHVKEWVSAINYTDNASSLARMSGMACCKVSYDMNAEPVLQITARDNSRYSLQSGAIGFSELGIRNILCVSGDSPRMGLPPVGKLDILDLDSVQMLWILRRMRDEGHYLDGRQIKLPPEFFLGAAASPFASEPEYQAIREQKKVNAGAQFLQTNMVFDTGRMNEWLELLYKRNISNKVYILIGVAPLRNLKMAHYLNNNIPGVTIPQNILKRIEAAGESAQEEGIQISLEFIDSIKRTKGVNGIHLMTMGCELLVPRIVNESGLAKSHISG